MKRSILIIAIALMATASACKKEYNTITPDPPLNIGSPYDVVPKSGQTTDVSDYYIVSNIWTLTGEYAYEANNIRVWKWQSGNLVVILPNVPAELFWNKQFKIGKTIPGQELLLIRKNVK